MRALLPLKPLPHRACIRRVPPSRLRSSAQCHTSDVLPSCAPPGPGGGADICSFHLSCLACPPLEPPLPLHSSGAGSAGTPVVSCLHSCGPPMYPLASGVRSPEAVALPRPAFHISGVTQQCSGVGKRREQARRITLNPQPCTRSAPRTLPPPLALLPLTIAQVVCMHTQLPSNQLKAIDPGCERCEEPPGLSSFGSVCAWRQPGSAEAAATTLHAATAVVDPEQSAALERQQATQATVPLLPPPPCALSWTQPCCAPLAPAWHGRCRPEAWRPR